MERSEKAQAIYIAQEELWGKLDTLLFELLKSNIHGPGETIPYDAVPYDDDIYEDDDDYESEGEDEDEEYRWPAPRKLVQSQC